MQGITPDAIAQFLTGYVVLLFSLSFHEAAHAWTALRMGDDTAARAGRISMNPIVHIDPLGTVVMPLLQLVAGGIPLLAWAKPTPVRPSNFHRGQLARGQILVSGAGPVSNLVLALCFAVALWAAVRIDLADLRAPVLGILQMGVVLNVMLAVFNLVPLPPLDGSHILSWSLPRKLAERYDAIAEPYGQWILLGLFVTGALGTLIRPIVGTILMLISRFVL